VPALWLCVGSRWRITVGYVFANKSTTVLQGTAHRLVTQVRDCE